MKNFTLHYYRFSYPMKLAERKNFLISDHSSGTCQVRYKREEMPFAIDSISTRNCYLIIVGWAFVTVAGLPKDSKLLL